MILAAVRVGAATGDRLELDHLTAGANPGAGTVLFGTSRQSRLAVTGTANERADARRRVTIVAAERPVEIRHVPEPDIERDRDDLQICMARIGQQTIGPCEALFQHVIGKARAFLFEQPLDEARRAAVTIRKYCDC